MFEHIKAQLALMWASFIATFALARTNVRTVWASNANVFTKVFFTFRAGFVIIAAVVALGVLTIVIPIVYLVSVSVGNTLPAGGLSAGQSSTLQTLVANGGSALVLTTTAETVTGAGIILLAVYLFMTFRQK